MASLFRRSGISGVSKWLISTLLVLSCYFLPITCAESMKSRIGVSSFTESNTPTAQHVVPRARFLSNSPLYDRPKKKHSSLHALSPTVTPYHGPLVISQPPSSSHLTRPSKKTSEAAPPLADLLPPNLADTSPTHSRLPQPALSPQVPSCCGPSMVLIRGSEDCNCKYPIKIDLLLTHVSESPKWELFLEELASGLRLHGSQIQLIDFYWLTLNSINISMDITPSTGISFSASNASSINSSLSMHKVNLDTKLVGVGDYKLLNITWFEAPAPSPAPVVAASPSEAPVVQLPTSNQSVVSKKGGHQSLILVITIGGFILISAIVMVLIICSCSTHPAKQNLLSEEPAKTRTVDAAAERCSLPHPSSTRFLSYEELKQATNNFETASILGEGGFGKVFKGVLSDGTAVAIKRLTNGGQQGDKEFLVEVEMLSRLHHRNLVKLVGYYSCRDSYQNLLCYELVSSGSLESWLHGPLGVNCPLDWDTRMKIALDAARGLAYLHEDSQPCVIHRDFKASNILLENNFHAKVADFGLAKQAPEGQANYLSTRVMGTFGLYLLPIKKLRRHAYFSLFMAVGNVLGFATGSYSGWFSLLPFTVTSACGVNCANLKSAFYIDIAFIVVTTSVSVLAAQEVPFNPNDSSTATSQQSEHSDPAQEAFFWELFATFRYLSGSIWLILSITALTWIGWFPFLLFDTDWMGREIYAGKPNDGQNYNLGVRMGALGLMLNAVVLGIISLLMEKLCKKWGAGIVWGVSNILMSLCFIAMLVIAFVVSRTDSYGQGLPSNAAVLAALIVFTVLGIPLAITYSVPYAMISSRIESLGLGQGLSMGVLNLAIVLPQVVVSLGSGPWDQLFGGGNSPSLAVAAAAAFTSGLLAILTLPRSRTEKQRTHVIHI